MGRMEGGMAQVRRHWFLLAMVGAIAMARAFPAVGRTGGPLRPEVTARMIGSAFIFWAAGAGIEAGRLLRAAANVRAHVVIAAMAYGLVPAATAVIIVPIFRLLLGVSQGAADDVADALTVGIVVLACLPSPTSTSLVLTKACDGNDATLIFNSTVGSILAAAVTPALCFCYLGASAASVPFASAFASLATTVFTPLLLGQLSRIALKSIAPGVLRWPLSTISQCVLVFTVYTTFCDAFHVDTSAHASTKLSPMDIASIPLSTILSLIVSLLTIHVGALISTFIISTNLANLSRRDTVAAIFCVSQKSLSLGVPIVTLMFGHRGDFGIVVLPLLVYHVMQLCVGSVLIDVIRVWVNLGDRLSDRHCKDDDGIRDDDRDDGVDRPIPVDLPLAQRRDGQSQPSSTQTRSRVTRKPVG